MRQFEAGDPVVYHKTKTSTHPGPRAESVRPAAHGDSYSYTVDKYWTVSALVDDETVELRTRTGKVHHMSIHDPNLRKARFYERMFLRNRFPDLESTDQGAGHE